MNEIQFYYNPFEAKVILHHKGKDELLSCMGTGQNSRLQDWLYDFLPELKKKRNWGDGSQCTITFTGTPGDFEDIELAYKVFKKDNPGIDISLIHVNKESKSLKTRMSDLKALFERMQKESPYDELKEKNLKPDFDRALNADFEISVIATMSSGKSTLINALLGQEILPARNEATTAKIALIRHNPNAAGFTVRGLKKDENEEYIPIAEPKPATLEAIEFLNSSTDIAKIELEGKIPGINSREMRLILSDTPGPNNSRTADHALHIDQLIKADYKPMIMYILNATQLEINDDKALLEKISKAMEGAGKQWKDRILFVLNKADELDPDKNELVEKKLGDTKKYLGQFGIESPRIFPASAYLAKIIRMTQLGNPVSRKEQRFLDSHRGYFIDDKNLHFSEYASLSPSCKRKQKEELDKAVAGNDENTQVFIYSGIRAIELAMDEYLEKYAFPAKISQAVDTFNNAIERLDLKNKAETELAQSEEKRAAVVTQYNEAIAKIAKGEEATKRATQFEAEFKVRQKKVDESLEECETKVNLFFAKEESEYAKSEITPSEANRIVENTLKNIADQLAPIGSDLKRIIDEGLRKQAENYLASYQKYVENLLKDNTGCVLSPALDLIQFIIPSAPKTMVEQFTETKTEKRLVESKGFFGTIGRFFGKIGDNIGLYNDLGYETKVVEKDIVRMEDVFRKHIQPLEHDLYKNIDRARKNAEEDCNKLFLYFKEQMQKLDQVVKDKIKEQASLLNDKEEFEKAIKSNQQKKEWLNQFIAELDAVLKV
jgi:GTPase Era involved in 16S rRNA processing